MGNSNFKAEKFFSVFLFLFVFGAGNAKGSPELSGWIQTMDSQTGVYSYKRNSIPGHLITIYPSATLSNRSVGNWLSKTLSSRKPPEGRWKGASFTVKSHSDTLSTAGRFYQTNNGTRKQFLAIASTTDRKTVRLGVMQNFNHTDKKFKDSAHLLETLMKEKPADHLARDSGETANEEKHEIANTAKRRIDGRDLSLENAAIPMSNHPVKAVAIIEIEILLLPTRSVGQGHMMMTFPNGYSTYCNKWNLVTQSPTPESIGGECKLNSEPPEDTPVHPFESGETIDAVFAGVRNDNWLGSDAAQFSVDRTISLTKDGRINLGVGTLSKLGVETTDKNTSGNYYLNGYTITIETDGGDLIHSHIGVLNKENGQVKSIFFNDGYYSTK